MIERIVILGHTGFIGGHLVRYLKDNSPEIEIIGRSFPAFDLTKCGDACKSAELFNKQTAVIMLSAIKRQFRDDLESFRQNLMMVTNLCKVLQEKPVARVIYFSSAAVYGEDIDNSRITEETPVCPTSYYGIAKSAGERIFWKTCSLNGSGSLVVLRPPTAYGPGDEGGTYGPVGFLRAAVMGDPIILWGDGEELRDFLFVEDLAAIVHGLVFQDFEGVLNVASGKSCSFRSILDTISRLTSRDLEIRSRPRTKNRVDNGFLIDGLMRALPGTKLRSVEEGMARMIESERSSALRRNSPSGKGTA